jgi:hypothetical protein
MGIIKLILMIQLTLVQIKDGGRVVENPALMSYNDTIMYVTLPDTVFTDRIQKITRYRGATIIGLERGIVVIDENTVYLKHYNSSRELLFIKDQKRWSYLKKKSMKATKTN